MQVDLIIIGGGLVGAGLAAALRDTALRIALVDARIPEAKDPRLLALHHGSCLFLKNLGLWDQLVQDAAPIHQVHISYQGRFGAVRLDRNIVNLPALGHVIPAYLIEAALQRELQTLPQLTLYQPAKLTKLQQKDNQWHLKLTMADQEIYLQSPMLIGADGTESTVREQLNMPTTVIDYQQSAIVTRIKLARAHQHMAYERFNEHGAIAVLPLTGHECATIWTADQTCVNALMALDENQFLQTLQKEFGYRLGRFIAAGQRHTFPLRMVQADNMAQQGVWLLGNAAHTLHPIAAQGLNLALYEVAAIAENISKKIAISKTDLSQMDLHQLKMQIKRQQNRSMSLSHHLSSIFSQFSAWPDIALTGGMMTLEMLRPLKKMFLQRMMGRAGYVPALLHEEL